MAGRGPAPKRPEERRRRNAPTAGEWKAAEGEGWQHGPIPAIPFEVRAATQAAWDRWMGSWFAAHWRPDDLPGLYVTIALYDEFERYRAEPLITNEEGEPVGQRRDPSTSLRQFMDNYGITPKGQQDRRWARPQPAEPAPATSSSRAANPYRGLRVV